MLITVIVANPNTKSFNHAIAQTAVNQLSKNGHEIVFHDLYAEKFDPILTPGELNEKIQLSDKLEAYCREISQSDGIIIIHPNWWGQPPAILKGWIDRVLRAGLAYKFEEDDKGEGVPVGLLKANTAVVFNTSNTESIREMNVFGDPLQTIWKNCIFDLCGVKTFYRETFSVVITSDAEQRRIWLEKVVKVVSRFFPEN
jgi:putative NADPH-quinone reductase